MAIPTGFRPRPHAARMEVARALARRQEALDLADPWVRACAEVAGRARVDDVPGDAPRVAIVVPTFNRAGMVGQAIASALRQTWPCQVIVIDDGSTDDTPRVLAGIQGITVLRQENAGKPAALERALAEVEAEALLILDDDDLLFPGSVRALAEPLFADPARVATWGDTIVFDGATGAPQSYRVASRLPGEMAATSVLAQIPALPGATLVRTSAQRRAGAYEPSMVRGQDMDMYLRLAELGPIVAVPLPVHLYRSHDGLRGSAAGQWQKKRSPAEHRARFLACVQPVFVARWRAWSEALGPSPGETARARAFAWALGLWERELRAEAQAELSRWPAPWSMHEAWVRSRCGLAASAAVPAEALLVFDDGDEGALEAVLARDARGRAVHVVVAHPREEIATAAAWWPGRYGQGVAPLPAEMPVHLRWSSAPGWTPPAVLASELAGIGPGSFVALAEAKGWEIPRPTRGCRARHERLAAK